MIILSKQPNDKIIFMYLLPPLSHSLHTNAWVYVPRGTRIRVWVWNCLERKLHVSRNENRPTSHRKKWRGRWHNNHQRLLKHEHFKYKQRRLRTVTRRSRGKKRSPRAWRTIRALQLSSIHVINSKLQGRSRWFRRGLRYHVRAYILQGPI